MLPHPLIFFSSILKIGDRVGMADTILLDRALELGRVMFSQDRDFLIEAQRRRAEGIDFAGVIFARQSRISIGDCIRDLEIIAKAGNPV